MTSMLAAIVLISSCAQPAAGKYERFALVVSADLDAVGIPKHLLDAGPGMGIQFAPPLMASPGDSLASRDFDDSRNKGKAPTLSDGIVVLRSSAAGDEIEATVIDGATGGTLDSFRMPRRNPPESGLAERLGASVKKIRGRYPKGVERLVLLTDCVPQGMGHDQKEIVAGISAALREGVAGLPGVAPVELDEAWAETRELAAAHRDVSKRHMAVMVAGEFREDRAASPDGRLRLTLRVSSAEGEKKFEKAVASIDEAAKYVSRDIVSEVKRCATSENSASLPRDAQVRLMAGRALQQLKNQQIDGAIRLHEAVLALTPGDLKLLLKLCGEYSGQVGYRDTMNWRGADPKRTVGDWRRRGESFRRCASLLRMVQTAGPKELAPLKVQADGLSKAMEMFCFFTPNDDHEPDFGTDQEMVMKVLRDEMRRCTLEHRALIEDLGPRMLKESIAAAPKDGKNLSEVNFWMEFAASWPTYSTKGGMDEAVTSRQLRHVERIAVREAPALPVCPSRLLELVSDVSLDADYRREFKVEEWREFIERLGESKSPLVREIGGLGAILCDRTFGRDGKKPQQSETLKRFDAWQAGLKKLPTRPDFMDMRLKRVRERLAMGVTPATPTKPSKPATPTRPAKPLNPPVAIGAEKKSGGPLLPLDFEQVRVLVRRKDGKVVPFTPSAWNEMETWGPYGKIPFFIRDGETPAWVNLCSIMFEREPLMLEEVYCDPKTETITDASWEGKNLWVISTEPLVRVWSSDGKLLALAGRDDGLPPISFGRIRGVSAGLAVAVATGGDAHHAWCADLRLKNGKIEVDVFHEATKALPDASRSNVVSNHKELDLAFVPHSITDITAATEGRKKCFAVERDTGGQYGLALWPEERRVSLFEFPLHGQTNTDTARAYRMTEQGDWYLAYSNEVSRALAAANGTAQRQQLASKQDASFDGVLFLYDGLFIAPGFGAWASVDPKSGDVNFFDRANLHKLTCPDIHNVHMGVSRLSGLLWFGTDGKVHRMLAGEKPSDLRWPTLPGEKLKGAAKTCMTRAEPVAKAIHAFRLARGLWPASLEDLTPEFLPKAPVKGFEYGESSSGQRLLRAEVANNDHDEQVVYVIGGTEQGWYRVRDGKAKLVAYDDELRPIDPKSPKVIAATIKELNRRVQAQPDEEGPHKALAWYLYVHGHNDDARAAGLEWAKALPFSANARNALVYIELRRLCGAMWYDSPMGYRAIARGPHKTFGEACAYFRDGQGHLTEERFAAIRDLPQSTDEVESLIAEYVMLSRANSMYSFKKDSQAIEACDYWEEKCNKAGRALDPSFVFFRCAAKLRSGDVEGARADAKVLKDRKSEPRMLSTSPERLLDAVRRGDTKFEHAFYEVRLDDTDWPIREER